MIGRLALTAYGAAGYAARPLIEAMLNWRVRRGKEDPARLGERLGISALDRPHGDLIWLHAASVGETNAILPLIDYLRTRNFQVLLTSGTVTSAAIADRRLPEGAVHQYIPLDVIRYIDLFLDHWSPRLAVFVESEIWPSILTCLHRRSIPLALVNARMSERSYRGWRRAGPIARAIMGRITICIAQSSGDARRFADLGLRDIEVAGNLKFDVPAPEADENELARLQAQTGDRPVLVAASTHDGEEAMIRHAHEKLRVEYPRLLTIIVPRHPARGDAIAADLSGVGLVVGRRSAGEPIEFETDIYLADSLGEMGLWFRIATLVFLGASLMPYGGHNPIEPAKVGVPMIHGPHISNFADIFATLHDARAAVAVDDAAGLVVAAAGLLADGGERQRLAREARACIERHVGALERTIAALLPYLEETVDGDSASAERA